VGATELWQCRSAEQQAPPGGPAGLLGELESWRAGGHPPHIVSFFKEPAAEPVGWVVRVINVAELSPAASRSPRSQFQAAPARGRDFIRATSMHPCCRHARGCLTQNLSRHTNRIFVLHRGSDRRRAVHVAPTQPWTAEQQKTPLGRHGEDAANHKGRTKAGSCDAGASCPRAINRESGRADQANTRGQWAIS